MDTERKHICADPLAGLGFVDPDGWYGGKVHFTGRIDQDSTSSPFPFRVTLNSPKLGSSCRFARTLGSESLLILKYKEDIKDRSRLQDFLTRKFVIAGTSPSVCCYVLSL